MQGGTFVWLLCRSSTTQHQLLAGEPLGLHTGLLLGEEEDTLLPDTQQLQGIPAIATVPHA